MAGSKQNPCLDIFHLRHTYVSIPLQHSTQAARTEPENNLQACDVRFAEQSPIGLIPTSNEKRGGSTAAKATTCTLRIVAQVPIFQWWLKLSYLVLSPQKVLGCLFTQIM